MLKPEWLVIGATTLFTGALTALANPSGLSVVAGGGAGAVGGSVLLHVEADRRKQIATLHTQLSRIERALASQPLPLSQPPTQALASDTLATILSLQKSLDSQITALQATSAVAERHESGVITAELISLLAIRSKLITLLRDHTNAVAHPAPYSVILYDLENLIHGNYDSKRSASLSFRKIRERIASQVDLGTICAQKAYANWSNGKLYPLRFSTLEEGVQPIQTYGFRDGENQDKGKNLADFHLFDEALRLLETQPHITTFVIASGDGDFIPLITRLKEHGKRVIVCANDGSENPKLKEFCDHLILIRLAEVIEERAQLRARENGMPAKVAAPIKPKRATWSAVNAQLVKQLGLAPATTAEAAVQWIHRLLQGYEADPQAIDLLKYAGQSISSFKIFLKLHIPQLDDYIKQVPTRKLKRYLEITLKDTAFTLVDLEGSVVLALQDGLPTKAKRLDIGYGPASALSNGVAKKSLASSLNERIALALGTISAASDADVEAAVKAILKAYVEDAETNVALKERGIGLSYLKEMVTYLIPDFERWQKQVFGFSKFGYYLRYLCRDTEFCVATTQGSNSVLLLRNHVPEGCVVLSDRDREVVPSVAVYAEFLKLDVPRLMLPQERTLPETTQYVLTHAQKPQTFADLEALISRESGLKVQEVRAGLNTLVRVGVLETQGKDEMAGRLLQLVPVYRDVDTVLRIVEAELRQRLAAHFDTVDADTLRQLIYPQVTSL